MQEMFGKGEAVQNFVDVAILKLKIKELMFSN